MAILVTGASAGFGEAMCRTFVQAGYSVIGAARRETAGIGGRIGRAVLSFGNGRFAYRVDTQRARQPA